MKISQGDELEWQRGLPHREGTFHYRELMCGETDRPDNFQISIGRNDADFFSPRHRHNFEQVRFQLEGEADFGRNGKLTPGLVGYFPEGAPYGPQTNESSAMTLVFQFAGASGSGYLAREAAQRAKEELEADGVFENGVFRQVKPGGGCQNTDGFQAIWEHVSGRPMVYPTPRYEAPVMIDPERFHWCAVAGAEGVQRKSLGVFTERETRIGLLKLDAGAHFEVEGRAVYFVWQGTGRAGDQPLRALTTLYLDWDERQAISADEDLTILYTGLPDLRDMAAA